MAEAILLQDSSDKTPIHKHTMHIGSHIGQAYNELNMQKACRDIITRTNIVMSRFGFCTTRVRSAPFTTYCTCYYGCTLWSLCPTELHRFITSWRKCIRRVWRLIPMTRSRYLTPLMDALDIRLQVLQFLFGMFVQRKLHIGDGE